MDSMPRSKTFDEPSEPPGGNTRPARPRGTRTSAFGVGKRESHDSSAFYDRFAPPDLEDEHNDEVCPFYEIPEPFIRADAAEGMAEVRESSVALVVTSPPYFAGKEYEEDLARGDVPSTYFEYLDLLEAVFRHCKKKLEPGGRIAVNVANLGRKPYRSLSADVIDILQNRLGLLLRGEVIWQKSSTASGNCAWGSFTRAGNPVIRDMTERVVIASKGRFDRAITRPSRKRLGLPFKSDLSNDEFMEATTDVWKFLPQSARKVGHPAPFPVELPERLIRLYTYAGDLVLDPFLGSGTTAIAAHLWDRRFVGYDIDTAYVDLTRQRVPEEVERRRSPPQVKRRRGQGKQMEYERATSSPHVFQRRAVEHGKKAQDIAQHVLTQAGFRIVRRDHTKPKLGVHINFVAEDRAGATWYFDVSGAFTTSRPGLQRTDTLWKTLGRASVLAANGFAPLVFLTTNLPLPGQAGDVALRSLGKKGFYDAMEMLNEHDLKRLRRYAQGGRCKLPPLPGFWTVGDVATWGNRA